MGEILKDGGLNIWASATDLTWWAENLAGSSSVNREASEKIEGAYSCRLDIDSGNNIVYIFQVFNLIPGRKYQLKVRYKNSISGKTASILLRNSGSNVWLDLGGSWIGSETHIILSNKTYWEVFTINFIAHASYSSYYIFFERYSAASSSIYFDDISIQSCDRCGFMWDNRWDLGTLTASSEVSPFIKENTRHRHYKKFWQSSGDSAEWLKLNRGGISPAIQAFINRYNNFSSSGTIKIQGNSSDSWSPPPIDQIIYGNTDIMAHLFTTPQDYQWWRHYLDDGSNPDTYLYTGRIFLGPIFEPERNFISGGGFHGIIDPSLINESDDGQVSTIRKKSYKPFALTFERISASDKDKFIEMFNAIGGGKSFFVCLDLGDPWGETYYVEFVSGLNIVPEYGNRWTINFSLRESR